MEYNFNESVRRVLAVAQEHSWRMQHEYIGTEHLLLGILSEREGIAPVVLHALHADAAAMLRRIEETVKKGKDSRYVGRALPFTSRSKTVLDLAIAEARELGHASVGPEHLLLGLRREEKGIGAQVLAEAGVQLDAMRVATLHALAGEPVSQTSIVVRGVTAIEMTVHYDDGSIANMEFKTPTAALNFLRQS